MLHDYFPFLRASLFAGAVIFVNYDMWAALKDIGVSTAGADDIHDFAGGGRMLRAAVIWIYLAEIVAGTVFFGLAYLHILLQKAEDGRRKILPLELFFIALAAVFAFFTTGFEELWRFLFG